MKRFISLPIIGTTSLIIATYLLGGCSRTAKKETPGAPVIIAYVTETNIPVQIDPPPVGHVTAYSSVTIRPQIGGVIKEIHFKEGGKSKKATCCSRLIHGPRRRNWTRRVRHCHVTPRR